MQAQPTLHPDGGQQVVLGVAEFAFGNGSTRIGEIATVHKDLPARGAVAATDIDRCVAAGERSVTAVEIAAPDVADCYVAEEAVYGL